MTDEKASTPAGEEDNPIPLEDIGYEIGEGMVWVSEDDHGEDRTYPLETVEVDGQFRKGDIPELVARLMEIYNDER